MKPLPQRKKTAEEIAALREGFMPLAPAPSAIDHTPPPEAAPAPPLPPAEPRPLVEAKPVRSLRKSEQGPSVRVLPAANARSANSAIPAHRHSDQELSQIRRVQAFEVQSPAAHLIALTAHPIIVGAGYFFVIAAVALPIIDWLWASVSYLIPASFCLAAFAVALFIFLKKKRSVHHAGFIAAIAFFTIIFGALYYFPHLRNAP